MMPTRAGDLAWIAFANLVTSSNVAGRSEPIDTWHHSPGSDVENACALLLAQPLTGLGNTLFHGRPFAVFAWQVPALFAADKTISHVFESLHELGAWALLLLIGLHAAAALFHALLLRDGVFQRMLP
jgi:Prokaryotic cytochrome b561